MQDISQYLLINKLLRNQNIYSYINQYAKELNLLSDNLINSYVTNDHNAERIFPNEDNIYNAAWYKNLIMANYLFTNEISGADVPEISDVFKDVDNCDFIFIAKTWNEVLVYLNKNLSRIEWNRICEMYKLDECSLKIQTLLEANIIFDMNFLQQISLDVNEYDGTKMNVVPEKSSSESIIEVEPIAETVEVAQVDETTIVNEERDVSEEIIPSLAFADFTDDISIDDVNVFYNYEMDESFHNSQTFINDINIFHGWLKEHEKVLQKKLFAKNGNANYIEHNFKNLLKTINDELNYTNKAIENANTFIGKQPYPNQNNELNNWVKSLETTLKDTLQLESTIDSDNETKLLKNEIILTKKKLQSIETALKQLS